MQPYQRQIKENPMFRYKRCLGLCSDRNDLLFIILFIGKRAVMINNTFEHADFFLSSEEGRNTMASA